MWALRNATRYAADRAFARDSDGGEVWVVAVKGTFDIHPDGTTSPAAEQLPVDVAPRYSGDPVRSSLLADGDLVLDKAATDLVLHASAHAPAGKPVRTMEVAVRLGDWRKALRVTGERCWVKVLGSLALSQALPFERLPITYERAAGGVDPVTGDVLDPANPAGTGATAPRSRLEGQRAPRVEAVGGRSRAPAGFGPIAPHWASRARFAGTYDAAWARERKPLRPTDFDARFFQCAPEDQQFPGHLRGGEVVQLEGLTPEGRFAFRLPFAAFAITTRLGRESVGHRAALHTVCIEPELRRVTMVWHTRLPCHGKVDQLRETVIFEKKRLEAGA